jgi:hypothetical protein
MPKNLNEIVLEFGFRVFMQPSPVWVGDWGTRPNQNFDGLGLKIAILFYSFVNTVLYFVSLETKTYSDK